MLTDPTVTKYFISVDIGTTRIRVCLFDSTKCFLAFHREEELVLVAGENEIEPDGLWRQFKGIVSTAIEQVGGDPSRIISLSLCCQRNTFISWDRQSLRPCHRLITWKDGRAQKALEEWNASITIRLLNWIGSIAYFFTRMERFKAAKIFRFMQAMVTIRFMATLEKDQGMRKLLEKGQLAMGCLDTWLIHKLSGGRHFVSEPSSASSTGLFDPFTGSWGRMILSLIGFPIGVLPYLVESAPIDGAWVDSSIFGFPIKIGASMGDAQAAVIGAGCTSPGSVKVSLGTGTFVDWNTGGAPHASLKGIYPLVGWHINSKSHYLLEGSANDTASVLDWAGRVGLFDGGGRVEESANIAAAVEADPHLAFVPGFGGIQTPHNDQLACAAFLGITPTTTRKQMLRALLESIAFTVAQILEVLGDELGGGGGDRKNNTNTQPLRVCGGVSQNDFICQQISTLTGQRVERVAEPQFSGAKGAALLAGVAEGSWTMDSINELVAIGRTFVFQCSEGRERALLLGRYAQWKEAQRRCLHFYKQQQ